MATMMRELESPDPLSGPPLPACPSFSTTDPDEAVHETAKVIAPHQMNVSGDPARFQASVRWASVGDASLAHLDYRSPLSFHLKQERSIVSVILPIAGDMAVSLEREPEIGVPRGACAVIPTCYSFELLYREPFSVFVMYAQTSALSNALRRMAPQLECDELEFEPMVLSQPQRTSTLFGLTNLLVEVVNQFGDVDAMPPRVARAMSDQVVTTYMFSLAHNRSAEMLRSAHPVSNRLVRRAVDVIHTDVYAEKTVTDVAEAVGVSLRSLELGFRKELGCTPVAYMRRVRLQNAHDQLRLARPGDGTTVTDVAIRSGFNHPSRFAAYYRDFYGVVPSETLRDS